MNNNAETRLEVSGNKTLAAVDSGVIQDSITDAAVFTLPAAAAGLVGASFIVRAKGVKPTTGGPSGIGANKSQSFTLAPAAADSISGGGLATPVVNKGLVLTKTAMKVGDFVEVVCSGVTGVAAWYVRSSSGTFTRVP